jgi:dolichol-phosphate mannosyltransferase
MITFKEKFVHKPFSKYAKFFAVSLIALAFNLLFLFIFTEYFKIYYLLSQLIAIALAMIINFLGNKLWTFGK